MKGLGPFLLSVLISTATAAQDRLPVLTVPAADTARERGRALGTTLKAQFPDIERHYDAALVGAETLPAMPLTEEIAGIADRLDLVARDDAGDGLLSLAEFRQVQALADHGGLADGLALGIMQGPVLRTQTLAQSPSLRSVMAVTVYADGVALIGPAGLTGAITGMNTHGLVIAALDGPGPPPPDRGVTIRRVLANAQTVKDAAEQLSSVTGLITLIADPHTARVLEVPAGGSPLLRGPNTSSRLEFGWSVPDRVLAIGCLVGSSGTCRDLNGRLIWSTARRASLAAPGTGVDALTALAAQPPFKTLQGFQIIAEPATRTLYIGHGQGPLRRYGTLFPDSSTQPNRSSLTLWMAAALALAAALLGAALFGSSKRPHAPDEA